MFCLSCGSVKMPFETPPPPNVSVMCGIIASLFLLQRLKGSVSCDARDFNNIETQAVKFFFLQGKAPKEIHAILTETLREHGPSCATVKNWVA